MKRLLMLSLALLVATALYAQPDKVYTSLRSVKNPQQVYVLKLRYKRLRSVPPEVFTFTNLRQLDLSRNFIDSLPPTIAQLSQLEELNVARNWIHHLPAEVGSLPNLTHIDVSRNPIQSLPETIGMLPKLQRLVAWQTGVRELPPSFVALSGILEVLDLRACMLTEEGWTRIKDLLPDTKVLWDASCNCSHD